VLDISLLGETRVAVDSTVVRALRSPRALALLGFLLVHRGAPQRREYVAAQFWPDSPEGQARTNLRRELHSLRAGLPQVGRWLTADGGTLLWRLDPECRLDVEEFEAAADAARAALATADEAAFRLAAASALRSYRGEFMPALYDDWAAAERDRLHRRCITVLDQLIKLESEAGAYTAGIELARRRIDLEPLEEVGYRSLLRLQGLAGDRAAAVQTYHRCASLLERELGVAPDRATTAEYQRLVGGQRGGGGQRDAMGRGAAVAHEGPTSAPVPLAAALAAPASGAPAAGQVPSRPEVPSPGEPDQEPAARQVRLVGREHELGLLQERWQQALRGSAGFAVLAGEAGVGKTRLLDELASQVRRAGFDTMRARCFAARGRLALAPVSEWLRSRALRSARDRLEPVWAREVDRLVPPADAEPMPPLSPMADAWQRHRFFEGLARAVLSTGRPALLLLDDLQWCDEHTLAWLQLLLHLGERHPMLVVAATRLEEIDGNVELTEMLRALRSAGQVTDIAVGPLDGPRSAELAGQVRGSSLADQEASWLHTATGGYPLLVIESIRAHVLDSLDADPGPKARAVLAGRIAQVGPAARDVAELAAVIGRDFTIELLTQAADLDPDSVIAAVDELWRRRIIREHSSASYDFAHDLLRDSAYGGISPPRRGHLHCRVAEALELTHADDPGVAAAALAYHYERAGLRARAVPQHVRAAEVATGVFANQKAVRHYRRAVELLRQSAPGRDRDAEELAIRAAMAAPLNAQNGYASTELQAGFERTRELAERLGDTRLQLISLVGLFGTRYVQGHTAESYDIARRSLELSDLHPDVKGQAHFALAGSATSLGHHEQSLPHFALAHELCHDAPPTLLGSRTEVHARAWSAHALWLLGRDDEALHWCDWAIARAEEVDHPYSLAIAQAYAAITHQLRGDRDRTMEFAGRVREICSRYDFAYYGNWGLILGGWSAGGTAGADQIRRGLQSLRDQGALARQPYYLALLAETLLAAGQSDAAGAVLESALVAAAVSDRWWLPELYRLDARRHRGAEAADLLSRAADVAGQQGAVALTRRVADDLAQHEPATATDRERSANG
jgi:DNA-binding SARP family transcriptional activator/tetratricopeptide (TPR) repeat protein